MNASLGAWGISVKLLGLNIHLFLGDIYVRVPRLGELAWNSTGFHTNRFPRQQ